MKFWVIAYQFHEDIYYDFDKNQETHRLNENCFLPTKKMAEEFIVNELGSDYVVVKITLELLDENGNWVHQRGIVKRWDGKF